MTWTKEDTDYERNFSVEEMEQTNTKYMDYELLTKIATLSNDINIHFEQAWKASMTQDSGQPDEVEMQHQINLAKTELQKLNSLVWPDSDFVLSDVMAAQRAEIEGLQSDVFNLEGMD